MNRKGWLRSTGIPLCVRIIDPTSGPIPKLEMAIYRGRVWYTKETLASIFKSRKGALRELGGEGGNVGDSTEGDSRLMPTCWRASSNPWAAHVYV